MNLQSFPVRRQTIGPTCPVLSVLITAVIPQGLRQGSFPAPAMWGHVSWRCHGYLGPSTCKACVLSCEYNHSHGMRRTTCNWGWVRGIVHIVLFCLLHVYSACIPKKTCIELIRRIDAWSFETEQHREGLLYGLMELIKENDQSILAAKSLAEVIGEIPLQERSTRKKMFYWFHHAQFILYIHI